jgi:hypothetical protein
MRSTIVLGVALVVMAAGCGSADLGSGGEPVSDVVEGSRAEPEAEPDPEPEAESVPEAEPEPESQREDIEIVEYGYSTFLDFSDETRASWAVILTNPNERLWIAESTDVTVTLLDDGGSVLASYSNSAPAILPGQSVALADSAYDDVAGVEEMRVQARTRNWEREEGDFGTFETSGVNLRDDDWGWVVTGSLSSTFDTDFDDVYAVTVLRDSDGALLGGGYTFIDFVPADGDTSFQIEVLDEIEGASTAEVFVQHSFLSLF